MIIKLINRLFHKATLKKRFKRAYSDYVLFMISYEDVLKNERKVPLRMRNQAIVEFYGLKREVKNKSIDLTEKEIQSIVRKVARDYNNLH